MTDLLWKLTKQEEKSTHLANIPDSKTSRESLIIMIMTTEL